jgi:hypothetical protein
LRGCGRFVLSPFSPSSLFRSSPLHGLLPSLVLVRSVCDTELTLSPVQVTRNWMVRTGSMIVWLASTTLLIYWSVLQTQDQTPAPLVRGTVRSSSSFSLVVLPVLTIVFNFCRSASSERSPTACVLLLLLPSTTINAPSSTDALRRLRLRHCLPPRLLASSATS